MPVLESSLLLAGTSLLLLETFLPAVESSLLLVGISLQLGLETLVWLEFLLGTLVHSPLLIFDTGNSTDSSR